MRGRPNRDKPPLVQLLPPCGVCGQKAAGFHYGVNTCEACKGFFRRSLLRKRPYECVQTRQCRIGSSTARRQSCPKCRYDKCISVGMSQEAIKTGRYSLSKKSKDIHDLLEHQQSSADETLNEELRVKAKQTLEKIAKASRRGRGKHFGDLSSAFFSSTLKGELDLIVSPPQSHLTKEVGKIVDPAPSNELSREVKNVAESSLEHQAFPNPRATSFSFPTHDDIKRQTSEQSALSDDGPCRYSSRVHTYHRRWNPTLPIAADANPSGYQCPPIICQCAQRRADIYHDDVTTIHPPSHNPKTGSSYHIMREHQSRLNPSQRTASLSDSSLNSIHDGSGATWTRNPDIHARGNSRIEGVSDTSHNSRGSRQRADYPTSSCSNQFHEMDNKSLSPLPVYSYCDEQDDSMSSLTSHGNRLHFSERRQPSSHTLSESSLDNFPVKAEPNSPQSLSISKRSHDGMPQIKRELLDGQNVNKISRVSDHCQGGTSYESTMRQEMSFEKLIARSIAGDDYWGGYSNFGGIAKDDKDVEVNCIDKQRTDTFSVSVSESRDVSSRNNTLRYEHEQDMRPAFKSQPNSSSDDDRLSIDDNKSRQKVRKTTATTTLPLGKSDDIRFSIFDMPRFIAGTDAFELPFIETFPFFSYENVIKSILGTCTDPSLLDNDTIVNPEGFRSTIRSIWEKVVSEIVEASTSAEISVPQQCDSKPCPTIATRSAFSAENLEGFNFSDYDSNNLEVVISGLIKSHEEIIGPDSNYLSDRQRQLALSVFQGLRRLKEELLRPYRQADSVNIWSPANQEWDFVREMVSRYSHRSDKNLPKVLMFYRSVPGFRNLSSRDKVTLVRAAITEFLFLSSLRGFDHKTMTLVDAINLMTIDLSTMSGAFPLFRDLCASMQLVSQEIKHLKPSKDILIVLKAISLMTPDRPNLENPEHVRQVYKLLHGCLQLLLKKQYGESSMAYDKIGLLMQTIRLSIERFKAQRDDNLKKLVEDIHVPLYKETVFHFLFE